jgi:hypothetical protein
MSLTYCVYLSAMAAVVSSSMVWTESQCCGCKSLGLRVVGRSTSPVGRPQPRFASRQRNAIPALACRLTTETETRGKIAVVQFKKSRLEKKVGTLKTQKCAHKKLFTRTFGNTPPRNRTSKSKIQWLLLVKTLQPK